MKRIALAVLALIAACSLTACSSFSGLLSGGTSSETAVSSEVSQEPSSEPVSSEELLGAMDNSEAIDYCLRIYNLIHPIAQLSSAADLADSDVESLRKLIAEVQRYGHDTDDQRTLYTVAMAGAAEQALNHGQDGYTDDTLSAAVSAASDAYYAMHMGFRQELRIIDESEWQKAAKMLAQK